MSVDPLELDKFLKEAAQTPLPKNEVEYEIASGGPADMADPLDARKTTEPGQSVRDSIRMRILKAIGLV